MNKFCHIHKIILFQCRLTFNRIDKVVFAPSHSGFISYTAAVLVAECVLQFFVKITVTSLGLDSANLNKILDYFSISFYVFPWLDYFPHISLICFCDALRTKTIYVTSCKKYFVGLERRVHRIFFYQYIFLHCHFLHLPLKVKSYCVTIL